MSNTSGHRTKYRGAMDKLLGNPVCRRVFDSSREGFLVTDRTGRLLEVNATLCDVLRVAREELLRMSLAELPLDPVTTAEHLEEIRPCFETAPPGGTASRWN